MGKLTNDLAKFKNAELTSAEKNSTTGGWWQNIPLGVNTNVYFNNSSSGNGYSYVGGDAGGSVTTTTRTYYGGFNGSVLSYLRG